MPVSFSNAPLVELIAELRWNTPHQAFQPQQPGILPVSLPLMGGAGRMEEFFSRFGGEAYQSGFQRAERTVPGGFPILPFQPVYRYRRAEQLAPELFQVGAGIFSANAIPPYQSWKKFSPFVSQGIEILLKSRDASEKDQPFSSVGLRYIDAFSAEHLQGMIPNDFISKIMGFKLSLPQILVDLASSGDSIKTSFQLNIPISGALIAGINMGEGQVNGIPALLLDTTISTNTATAPSAEAVMAILNQAHLLINNMFMEFTRPIHAQMIPSGEE
jgi:uncharacterized protein (TIGR04255 family)